MQFDFDIIRSYESDTERVRAIKAIEQADICIVGAEDHSLLKGIHRPFLGIASILTERTIGTCARKPIYGFPSCIGNTAKNRKARIYCALPITLNETSICVASIAITALDLVTFPKGTSETL